MPTPNKDNKGLKSAAEEFDWAARDTQILREGTKIILPSDPVDMSYPSARQILKRAEDAENMVYSIQEAIPVHFFDGLVALFAVMKEKYGFVGTQAKQTWWGEIPPRLIHVKVGPKPQDFVQVPMGQFKLPNVEGVIETQYTVVKGIPQLQIVGEVKSLEKKIVMELVLATREYAAKNSIYKGRCVVLDRDESGGIDFDQPLEYFDPFTGNEVPIFNAEIENLVAATLLTPVENAEQCRKMKVPLKRGVLLEGPYGTGKSLTARQTARVASNSGWTFLSVTNSKSLRYALHFAKMYQPCVIFAEDIDRLTSSRNEGANDLINEIDGVVGKNDEIITVLTTNFADKIDKAMLRPGRLDAVISLRAPEKDAVQRLIRFYAGDLLAATADLDPVSTQLAGQIPATIREVVERAKLFMIQRSGDGIDTDDLLASTLTMKNHLDLLNGAREGQNDPTIDDTMQEMVRRTVKHVVAKVIDERIQDRLLEAGRPKIAAVA